MFSGGKDGRVCVFSAETHEQQNVIEFGVLPRAIDVFGGKMVVGLRTGSIVECDMESGEMTTHVESHNSGEVWGLDIKDGFVYTAGDDNQVIKWDPATRRCADRSIVNEASRRARRNKASTLSQHPHSQQARAVAVSPTGWMAVAANDGSVTIRRTEEMSTVVQEIHDSKEWIEVAEFSPDGRYLAIGSHDTNIYVYDTETEFARVGTCTKHSATITCIDWSVDGTYIRSVCNAYELLFFTIPDCS